MKRLYSIIIILALIGWNGMAHAAGCGIGAAGTTQSIAIGNTGRSMLIHLPVSADGSPLPVLFLFHGSTGTGAGMLKDSRLEETADRHGFIVAAPDGGIAVEKGFVWNIPGVPTVTGAIPTETDADDVAYIGAAIDWLVGQGCVARDQVYATGLSGGGRMTSWLGCVDADRFAAIAPVVGLRAGNPSKADPTKPDPATCKPSRPMPVIAFAGDKDTTNPIEGGGAGYWQYTMHAAEQRWAQLNGCAAAPTTEWVATGVYEERYTGCRGGADVAGRITVGGKHQWVVDNEAMWAFLSHYRR
ncbi:alpha/beta hydrolase family esterase [Asticcacaulis sp.]|uniref:alpha/beta hydrolase family esterase n=1 Tax=Asticcacaulis sp. TaxID=1872648 RepID=UPI002B6FEEBC|nr:PHB depolymerase family esterase [Asticcacaulis sp.]HTM81646.1 PHB depolymerase family esterase [Asticcacaulis sp.]